MSKSENYYSQSNGINRIPLFPKVNPQVRAIIDEIASTKGMNINQVALMLIEMGLEYYQKWEADYVPSKQMAIYRELRKIRLENDYNQALAEIKQNCTDQEFQEFIQKNGINTIDLDEYGTTETKSTKRMRAQNFIRILFTDRPEGLPSTRFLYLAQQEGFGEKMVYEEAKKLGIEPVKIGDNWFWKYLGESS
jgi:hypothetical protein